MEGSKRKTCARYQQRALWRQLYATPLLYVAKAENITPRQEQQKTKQPPFVTHSATRKSNSLTTGSFPHQYLQRVFEIVVAFHLFGRRHLEHGALHVVPLCRRPPAAIGNHPDLEGALRDFLVTPICI